MIFIILNVAFSILSCVFICLSMLRFKSNSFFLSHSDISYLMSMNKNGFRKRVFRVMIYGLIGASIAVVFTVSKLLYQPLYPNTLTGVAATMFFFSIFLVCFKVFLLHRSK